VFLLKKNTGCGCNSVDGHKGCPPEPHCDVAHSRGHDCVAVPFPSETGEEITAVLADVELQTLVEADIKLPTFASAIKHIKKNVRLTQCKALPATGNPGAVKLFVEGFVHKNIQYVEDCSGVVKDYSVNVPFRCYQQVAVDIAPVFPFGEFSQKGNIFERRELDKDGMGADRCTMGSLTFEVFTEPIKCKLLFAAVNQWDILENFDNWGRFNHITEKMEVFLIIKLTQKNQGDITPPTPTPGLGFNAAATTFNRPATLADRVRQIMGG
jgi:hypothetical protein